MSGSECFRTLSRDEGLELFDRAVASSPATVVCVPYDVGVIRTEVAAGTVPRLLSALGGAGASGADEETVAQLTERVRSLARTDQRPALADELRGLIAGTLGYDDAARLDLDVTFVELGFDSLVALDLRKRLQSLTGLTLPRSLMFDHPTPAALVDYVHGLLKRSADDEQTSLAVPSNGDAIDGDGLAGLAADGASALPSMFRRAQRLGKIRDGIALAEVASRLRPRFGLSHVELEASTPLALARGDGGPTVFCFPSVVATGGPHEYVRFARGFNDRCTTFVVPVPGFAPGQLLPETLEAAVAAQVEGIRRHVHGREIALVGHSTGGILAYAAAAACADEGLAPLAVVMIDSYTPSTMERLLDPVFERMLVDGRAQPSVVEVTLTAMGAYLRLLSEWEAPEPVVPTLLVQAAEPMVGIRSEERWRADWPARHEVLEAPGSHLTILDEHAETTARVVEDWLARAAADRRHGVFLRRPALR